MREMADSLCEPVRTVAKPGEWPEAEFQRFFLEHYSRVAGILLRIVGERARAEELASVAMPSEARWRRAVYEMQSPVTSALNLGPFSQASVPSRAMVVYAEVSLAAAFALALARFGRRDL